MPVRHRDAMWLKQIWLASVVLPVPGVPWMIYRPPLKEATVQDGVQTADAGLGTRPMRIVAAFHS